jgi:hypothetical protein
MPVEKTKSEARLEEAIRAHAQDDERVFVLERAKRFKRTWIELAQALVEVRERESYLRWGYGSFDEYVTRELRLKRGTVDKLCASYGFLRANAPRLAREDPDDFADVARPIPSWQAVDFVARAEERGAASAEVLDEMKHALFDEGAPSAALQRKYREVAFPLGDDEKRDRLNGQIIATAKRLADLVSEPELRLPRGLGEKIEAVVGELCEVLGRRAA